MVLIYEVVTMFNRTKRSNSWLEMKSNLLIGMSTDEPEVIFDNLILHLHMLFVFSLSAFLVIITIITVVIIIIIIITVITVVIIIIIIIIMITAITAIIVFYFSYFIE